MIRIVIAEDQKMLLGTIGSLLNLEDDMEVVGQAGNGEEALRLVNRLQPDVCIMDIEMPEKSGLEAAEALMPLGCKVIILTTFARAGYFQRVLNANVRGYLLKDNPSEELACSIRSIIAGKRIYSPDLMDDEFSSNEQEMARFERLVDEPTINENSIQPSKTIGTVRNYISTIMDKIKSPTG
jgi:two-component system, NarL family, response regulator DesR